jgi:hypothetical protein
MPTEDQAGDRTPLYDGMDDIRRELVLWVVRADRTNTAKPPTHWNPSREQIPAVRWESAGTHSDSSSTF